MWIAGVSPLSVLEAPEGTKTMVLEMAMRGAGDALTPLHRPFTLDDLRHGRVQGAAVLVP